MKEKKNITKDSDMKVLAFYRTESHTVLEPGIKIAPAHWPGRLASIFAAGDEVWQLHLDNAEDFENIKKCFYSPDYWAGRTWSQEYQNA